MKNAVYLTVLSIVVLFYSCGKSSKCADVIENGYSNANSSYNELKSNAELWFPNMEDQSEISISFTDTNKDCFLNSLLSIRKLELKMNDTLKLFVSPYSTAIEDASAFYNILDGDITPVEEYKLVESENISNWILLESINADSTEINGRFNMSFVTKNEKILSGERERSDDPNRPDTLHFFDGEFMAARIN